MNKPRHTPGPWSLALLEDLKTHGDQEQCDECEANAQLISAAPDMLSALEAIAHGMIQTQGFIPGFMEQAIAKAKGEAK